MMSVRDFRAVGDGVADDADAIEHGMQAALATGQGLYFPPGVYQIGTAKTFTYSGDLRIMGAGATILLTGASPAALTFTATRAATTTLSVDANDGARTVTVASATGMAAGQLIYFSTNTPVDKGFGYKKQSALLVARISGNTLFLSEPMNFGFSVAETTVTTYQPASLHIESIKIKQDITDRRLNLRKLQNCTFRNVDVEGYDKFRGDVILIGECQGIRGSNIRIRNGRYPINVSNASRNLLFEDVFASDCRHPIDCNTWTFNTRIRRLRGVNTQAAIECHPSFETHFEDCIDFSESSPAGGIGLRCIGGSVKRTKVSNINGTPVGDTQGPLLLAEYQYLGQKYDRVYEDIRSNTAILSASDVRRLIIRRCNVPNIVVDGVSGRIGDVSIDADTVVTGGRMTLMRVPVLQQPGVRLIASPPDSFASVDTTKDITGITRTNPAVVTSLAHGFANGDLIRIDGVAGMTQVNKNTYTVANATTDRFELSGVDSTAYGSYSSGGKATKGRLAKTIDPLRTPGLGWSPRFHAKTVIRKSNAALGATSVTIPVKVIDAFGIQEKAVRHALLTVRSTSSVDGDIVSRYKSILFHGSKSHGTINRQDRYIPSTKTYNVLIDNFRPHFYAQVSAEGGNPSTDASLGQYYFSFDVIVTANDPSGTVKYIEVEVDEIRTVS